MAASRQDISRWLDDLYATDEYTHMIVVCDTFDYEDYPVYVPVGRDVREVVEEKTGKNMQRLMEVYSRNHSREEQLGVRRAFNYD